MPERIFIPLNNNMTRVLEHTPDDTYLTYVCDGIDEDMNLDDTIIEKRTIDPALLELFLCEHAKDIA